MGAPMAVHLLHAGHEVRCYNRTMSKTAPVVEAGGAAFGTSAEAAQDAEIVITMVTDGPDVEEVLFGQNGALQRAKPGALVIDMSTISPEVARCNAERAKEFRVLDAPVTGGETGAKNATLSIMVGGSEADFEAARPVFEVLGKTITYCGPHGAGQSVKLCNQICGAMNLLGVCEALILGQKQGVDPNIVAQVINGGAASSWAMQNLAPKINAGDFSPGFMIDTQQKDMRLVMQAAEKAGVPLLGAALAQQLWRAAQVQGHGSDGIQAMFKVLAQVADLENS